MNSLSMQQQQSAQKNMPFEIDIWQILRRIWFRIWVVLLVGVIGGVGGFCLAQYRYQPKYSSSAMFFVNSNSVSVGSIQITASELSKSENLLNLYMVILKNRTTLEEIITAEDLPYSYEQLSSMISSNAVENTPILRITVTSSDPYEAAQIVNTIAEVLPKRISTIIKGSSMVVVDAGIPNLSTAGPQYTKYTLIGFLLGVALVCGIIAVATILDDTIHGEDYIIQNYDFPILAQIPDLTSGSSKKYGHKYGYSKYYYRKKGYGYGYGYGYGASHQRHSANTPKPTENKEASAENESRKGGEQA